MKNKTESTELGIDSAAEVAGCVASHPDENNADLCHFIALSFIGAMCLVSVGFIVWGVALLV